MSRAARWAPAAAVVALALAAALPGLTNLFTSDDLPLILHNPAIQDPAGAWRLLLEPYWPAGYVRDLYRPLTSLLHVAEWQVGGGDPWLFHGVSALLYGAVALAVLGLARRWLTPVFAFVAAALFAVHPLHTETVALGVNQAELLVALCLIWAVGRYLDDRARPEPRPWRGHLPIVAAYAVACLAKESALVLPGLLLAAEWTAPPPPAGRRRLAGSAALWTGLALVAVAFLVTRTMVLQGDVVGSFTAEALRGLTGGQRLLTMLAVVPEWVRLLLWPAHLQADYSPREIEAALAWGPSQILGLVLVIGGALIAWRARRPAPAVAFGLLWMAVALFPVSNVLVPTGIVLAERTLFLASAGIVIAVAGGAQALALRRPWAPAARWVAAAGLTGLLALGLGWSARRMAAWHGPFTLYRQTVLDAPFSYRAYWNMAEALLAGGRPEAALEFYRQAIALYPHEHRLYTEMADLLRSGGACAEAVSAYRSALELDPGLVDARFGLASCLLVAGHYEEAAAEARRGAAGGVAVERFQALARQADSLAGRKPD